MPASETTSTERIIASDASYPLSSFLPFQTANQVHSLVFAQSSNKAVGADAHIGPPGKLRIRRRFPLNRPVLPGRCGHRPLRRIFEARYFVGAGDSARPRMQHFLLLLQKKTLAKEKEPEGISNFPSDSLKATKKTASVFLELSRAKSEGQCKTSLKGVGADAHIGPPGKLRIRRRFPLNRPVLPGRCGHRPLRLPGRFSRASAPTALRRGLRCRPLRNFGKTAQKMTAPARAVISFRYDPLG